jgi:hypothetical protein
LQKALFILKIILFGFRKMDLYRQLHEIMMQRCGEQQNGHDLEYQNRNDAGPSIEQPTEVLEPPQLPSPIILSPPSSLLPASLIPTKVTPREDLGSKPSCSTSKEVSVKVKLKKKDGKKEKSKESEKKTLPVSEKSVKPERPRIGETTLSGIQAMDSERLEICLKNFKFEIYDMKV